MVAERDHRACRTRGEPGDVMTAAAIRTEGLTKRYGAVAALDDLDLEIGQGEVVGYLGPNGAGKIRR
jgi:ABC-type sugar transport system ATPase subunit